MLVLLLVLVIVDFATGWAEAWARGELKSRVGYVGIIRKVAIFAVVAIAHLIDGVLGDLHMFRDAVVFFYLANELLSVVENLGKMGVPMPPIIRDAVHIFQSKTKIEENPQLIPEAQPESVKMEKAEEAAGSISRRPINDSSGISPIAAPNGTNRRISLSRAINSWTRRARSIETMRLRPAGERLKI